MKEKKHNLIYKITNKLNKFIYIGVHKTNNLNDKYLGSGIEITKIIKELGKENFKKEILFDFKTYKEALNKEKEIVNQKFLKRNDIYNRTLGGISNAWFHAKGKLVVRDLYGNTFQTNSNNPKIKSGELKPILFGKVAVKDSNGKTFSVSKSNPRYLNGELVGINKNLIYITNGNKNKLVENNFKIPKGWKRGQTKKNIKTSKNYILINNGDKNFYIPQNKEIPKGFSKGSYKSTVTINNGIENKKIILKINETIPTGWNLGAKKFKNGDSFFINNGLINKRILKTENIPKGFKKGMIKKFKCKRICVYKNDIVKFIYKDEKIPKGWNIGRPKFKKITITNGFNNKKILKTEVIPKGWRRGMVRIK